SVWGRSRQANGTILMPKPSALPIDGATLQATVERYNTLPRSDLGVSCIRKGIWKNLTCQEGPACIDRTSRGHRSCLGQGSYRWPLYWPSSMVATSGSSG